MARHLTACTLAHDAKGGTPAELWRLRVQEAWGSLFWLDLEIKADARLGDLDRFLRDVWLECCGHLSAFTIGSVRYEVEVAVYDLPVGLFDGPRPRSMHARLGEVVRPGLAFRYEYDFGSTTELKLKVAGVRQGRIGRRSLRLLARNEPAAWQCAVCAAPATEICTWCTEELQSPFFCKEHARAHVTEVHDEEEGALLPVVNSPRMGVCAYTGPEDDRYDFG